MQKKLRKSPIRLLNVALKISTKFIVKRFTRVINDIVGPTQTAFLKGRYIMERVCVLHEVLTYLRGKIKWTFLVQILEMKGIPRMFIDRIMSVVTSGKVGIRVNWEIGPYFNTY
jgi:hypothetical protein